MQGPGPVLSSVGTRGLQCSSLLASLLALSPSVLNDAAKDLDSKKRLGSLRSCCCALARKRWSLQDGLQWEKRCSREGDTIIKLVICCALTCGATASGFQNLLAKTLVHCFIQSSQSHERGRETEAGRGN